MRIEFIVKCLTLFGLREVGDVVDASEGMAQTLIASGYAKPYVANQAEVVTKKSKRKGGSK